jgi:hypothetical protein
MKFREPTKLHRKSGVWGTRLCGGDSAQKRVQPTWAWKCLNKAADSTHLLPPYGQNVLLRAAYVILNLR